MKVLILIPYYNIYPPLNGGMQRCFHILHQLAKYFEVTAIVFQKPEELKHAAEIYPPLKHVDFIYVPPKKVPGRPYFRKLQKIKSALLQRWYTKNMHDSADSIFLSYLPYVARSLSAETYDIIILENLSTVKLSRFIKRKAKRAKIYYDAHNFDSHFAAIELSNNKFTTSQYNKIASLETNLYKLVDGIFVCSGVDKEKFASVNNNKLPCYLIPNGVSIRMAADRCSPQRQWNFTLLFCGSLDYNPNVDGLCWFLNECWHTIKQNIPQSELIIIGSGKIPEELQEATKKDGVNLIGRVEDTAEYYDKSTVAIVPIRQGSGTRLKILEAMESKLPVVSTTIGAEGINYIDGKNIVIADGQDDFSSKIIELLFSVEKRVSVAYNAYELVKEQYDWDNIGRNLNAVLNDS